MTPSPVVSIESKRPVAVWLLSDTHHGHVAHDAKLYQSHVEAARRARARVLFLGDALEAVTTGGKVANLGGHFDQTMSIGDQEDAFIDSMAGLRVLACVEGNHEARVTRTTGTSPFKNITRILSARQGYPCDFLQHGGHVAIRVGTQTYRLVIHHGEGGPTTFFRYLQRDFPGADLYAGGHTHELASAEYFVHGDKGPRRVTTVRTGSYLAFPSYAASKPTTGGIPATGSYLLWLRPDRHLMTLEKMSDRLARVA